MNASSKIKYVAIALDTRSPQYISDKTGAPRVDLHDGKVYSERQDALDYIMNRIDRKEHDKFVLCSFMMEPNAEYAMLQNIETYGFQNDRKKPDFK